MAIAIDTETHRFGPFNMAPKVVCLSYATRNGPDDNGILVKNNILDFMHELLDGDQTIVRT